VGDAYLVLVMARMYVIWYINGRYTGKQWAQLVAAFIHLWRWWLGCL